MKLIKLAIGVCVAFSLSKASGQIVKDPFVDYYQFIKSGDTLGDDEPHYSPQTKIYYFKADFTGDNHKSLFISDDESRRGPHGDYGWSVYYPLASGGYKKLLYGVDASLDGPPYMGYVSEIKKYGIVDFTRHAVSVQFRSQGEIDRVFLGKNEEAEKEDYPQYFAAPSKLTIKQITLAQLQQKFNNLPRAN